MAARFKDLVLDAGDHHALADWWCAAMRYRRSATVVRERDADIDWTVLADPQGNEFCVFEPR